MGGRVTQQERDNLRAKAEAADFTHMSYPRAVLALLDAIDAAEKRAALWKRAAKRHHHDLNLHGLLRPRQYRVIDY
jgi:hypothetical protein